MIRAAIAALASGCVGAAPEAPPPPAPGTPDCDRVLRLRSGPDRVEPGVEEYRTYEVVVPDGGFATRIEAPESPPAVHHVLLTREERQGPEAAPYYPVLFASGRGRAPLEMPPGVGLRIDAGETLLLGLHVVNATDALARFDHGVEVCVADEVAAEADVLVLGPEDLLVPPDGAPHAIAATRAVDEPGSFFAVFPHMHAIGTRIEVTLRGEPMARVDPWDVADQPVLTLDPPFTAQDGDTLRVECTYANPGPEPVGWGPYSGQEMCLAFLYSF